ncbi:hypothetical protein JCM8097_008642 [Rhodosporidiobolus ruineniae]
MLPSPPLTLTPIPLSALTAASPADLDTFVTSSRQASLDLLATLPLDHPKNGLWKPHKEFHAKDYPTMTWSTARGKHAREELPYSVGDTHGFKWHVRQSKHPRTHGSFDEFKAGLLENHSENEAQYIHECTTAERVEVIREGEVEVWRTKYINPPASPRAFTFLLLTLSTTPAASAPEVLTSPTKAPLRAFVVISLPVDSGSAVPGHVQGRYVSVEHVQETEEGGVVWTMAVSSDAGGWVPRFMSEHVMPSKIAADVPSFIGWLKKRREGRAGGAA